MSSTNNMNNLFSELIAEEAQLLAEEKWIIDSINKIKEQRNGLQIERLHLESLRAEQNVETYTRVEPTLPNPPPEDVKSSKIQPVEECIDLDSKKCNMEELDLNVSKPVLAVKLANRIDMSNEDEDDLESEEDGDDDDINMDINMFMEMTN